MSFQVPQSQQERRADSFAEGCGMGERACSDISSSARTRRLGVPYQV